MKYILVIHDEYHKQIPNVIEDYIFSLNIFSEVICLSELTSKVNLNLNEIFILVQMYLPDSFFQQNKTIFSSIQNKLCFPGTLRSPFTFPLPEPGVCSHLSSVKRPSKDITCCSPLLPFCLELTKSKSY